MLLVSGRQMVRNEGNIDVGLSDKESLHSLSVVAEVGQVERRTLTPLRPIIR